MADVFVSYVSEDRAIAEQIARGLEGAGFSVWWDRHIRGGVGFRKEIDRQLGAAKVVVVLWSAASLESEWVCDEAQQALDENKLIPVRLDNVQPPLGFRQTQSLDFEGWNGDLTASDFLGLVHSIRLTLGSTAAAFAPPLVRKNSICVLPFVNMSGNSEQEYFSDGISEDIITDLSKVSALFVIARHTAFTFKGKSVDVAQVAQQLNVSHVLEGSVRRAAGRVRITAQLIDGRTGGQVWAERFDRDLNDIFALQDEIAETVVKALKLRLLQEERQRIEQKGTSNLDAYDLYLQAKPGAFLPEENLDRIRLLEAATRLAPDYADAWGALALKRSYWRFSRPYAERDSIGIMVAAEAERALTLDPRNIAASAARYLLLPPFGRFVDAEALIHGMQENAPNHLGSFHWRTFHLGFVGRMREAIDVARAAYDMDPLNPYVANMRGATLYFGGRYAEARTSLEATLARWPHHPYAAVNLVLVCLAMQDWETVDVILAPERLARFPLLEFASFPRYVSIVRDPSPQSRRQLIEPAQERFKATGYTDLETLVAAAQVGDCDEAHTIAAQAKFGPTGTSEDEMGFDAYRTRVIFVSYYSEFRRDPRFVNLCARLGLVDYWLTTQKWPDCIDEVAPYYDFKAECRKVAAGLPLTPANETASPAPAI